MITTSPYTIENPEQYKGKWATIWNNHPIYVEIGMGKGDFIIENAKRYPHINFIGIEKFDSVLVRAVEKLQDINLPNLKLIRMDANHIEDIFDHEISQIFLNFSDPWPKNRHEHRRLSSPTFLKKYDNVLKEKKRLIMKTDNRNLFEYSLFSLLHYGYQLEKISLDLHADENDIIETEYEKKFSQKGFPIYYMEVAMDTSLTNKN